jgi:hypothetical protein
VFPPVTRRAFLAGVALAPLPAQALPRAVELPRADNTVLARLMDAGLALRAEVRGGGGPGGSRRLWMTGAAPRGRMAGGGKA